MESNLLINHPASLDTVTRLWRGDSDACIPVHLRISQTALYHCSIYVCISNHLCRQFYIWDATEAGEQLFFCRHPFRPDSHSFPTTCVLLQSQIFGFGCNRVVCKRVIIFHLYFRRQIPTRGKQLCSWATDSWLFRHLLKNSHQSPPGSGVFIGKQSSSLQMLCWDLKQKLYYWGEGYLDIL